MKSRCIFRHNRQAISLVPGETKSSEINLRFVQDSLFARSKIYPEILLVSRLVHYELDAFTVPLNIRLTSSNYAGCRGGKARVFEIVSIQISTSFRRFFKNRNFVIRKTQSSLQRELDRVN